MAFIRALVQIPRETTDTADVITNTLYFDSDSGNADDVAPEVHAELTAFYQAIDSLLAGDLLGNTATVDYYDLTEDEPRVPVYTSTIALTCGTGIPLPPELSVCLSFHASEGSGVNMRRRRGRIYLPPMETSSLSDLNGRVTVANGTVTTVTAAATNLLNQTTTFGTKWAVYSPTTYADTNNLDDAFNDVVGGWVDNEWDIQRRRGTIAQSRTLWS